MKTHSLCENYKAMFNGAVNFGVEYLSAHKNIESLIIGVSGGIDSAVVTAMAASIRDAMDRPINIIGRYLPTTSNAKEEKERAQEVANTFCNAFALKNIETALCYTLHELDEELFGKYAGAKLSPYGGSPVPLSKDNKVRIGNIKARLRMLYLYNLANKHKGLVLSTDNFTELNLGFWTLHGDVGDLGLIQQLWKTEVYGIAESIGGVLYDFLDATPTDGLGITNSDIDQILPYWTPDMGSYRDAYQLVDNILIDHISEYDTYSKDHPVIQRYINSKFKRENPTNAGRDLLVWRYND